MVTDAVAAVMMVKDEVDIVGITLRHLAEQVDFVLVADNGSTDGTRDLLDDLARDLPITVLDDPDPAYYQSEKVSRLAHLAHDEGADWVVPADADEIWMSPFGRIADVLRAVPDEWLIASAALYDHVATGSDPDVADPVRRIGHRRERPAELPKVAARTACDLVIEQGNHNATYTTRPAHLRGQLVVRHFPYRSPEQFVRKVRNGGAAVKAANLPPESGAHWRGYHDVLEAAGEDACAEIFRTWFWQPDGRGLIYDPVPCP